MAVQGFSRKGLFFVFTFLFVLTCSQTLSPPNTLQEIKANYEKALNNLEAAKADYEKTMATYHMGVSLYEDVLEPEILHEHMMGGSIHPDVDLEGIKATQESLLATGRRGKELEILIKDLEEELERQRRDIAYLEALPSAM